jgi:hypothetical protein
MFRAHDSLSSSLASSASIARRSTGGACRNISRIASIRSWYVARRGGCTAVIATPVSLLTRRLVRIARWGFIYLAHLL